MVRVQNPATRSIGVSEIRLNISFFFKDFAHFKYLSSFLHGETNLQQFDIESAGLDLPFLCVENHGSLVFYNNSFNSTVLYIISGLLSAASGVLNIFILCRFSRLFIACELYNYTESLLSGASLLY